MKLPCARHWWHYLSSAPQTRVHGQQHIGRPAHVLGRLEDLPGLCERRIKARPPTSNSIPTSYSPVVSITKRIPVLRLLPLLHSLQTTTPAMSWHAQDTDMPCDDCTSPTSCNTLVMLSWVPHTPRDNGVLFDGAFVRACRSSMLWVLSALLQLRGSAHSLRGSASWGLSGRLHS